MKFVSYLDAAGSTAPGVLEGDAIYDLRPQGVVSIDEMIQSGNTAVHVKGPSTPLAGAKLLAPITRPPRIFCVGLNYVDHAAESKMQVSKVPTIFMKLASGIVGPEAEVILPTQSQQVDYEVELAVVIGKQSATATDTNWRDSIFGYTILNDVSARDVQLATSQWTLGKSFATFCPIGPYIVTADEIVDPHALPVRLAIDGEVLQNGNTRDFIFDLPAVLKYISSITPLLPGDIISTGTPPGVGLGRTPQRWLKPGETMVASIDGLGELRNPVRAE